jgi:hypothetical protein
MSHIPYFSQTETESKHMSKNGYELRAQLLELAKDYLDKQHAANKEYIAKLLEIGQIHTEAAMDSFKPYTFDSIIEHANKMYEFVGRKA